MKVILISFDAMEHDFVVKCGYENLLQKEHGILDLEPYLDNRPRGRGSGDPFTPEVYATFISGIVPKESYDILQRGFGTTYPTIFQLSDKSLAIDVPAYCGGPAKAWIDRLTGAPLFERYWRNELSLEFAEEEYYKWMNIKASYARLISKYEHDLILFYFKEPDKLQHMYYDGDLNKYKRLYSAMDNLAGKIINAFNKWDTAIIIFSDHGVNFKGGHSQHGFWSSNIPLERGDRISIIDWYEIIKEIYRRPARFKINVPEQDDDLTDEDKKAVEEHLRKLGYFG